MSKYSYNPRRSTLDRGESLAEEEYAGYIPTINDSLGKVVAFKGAGKKVVETCGCDVAVFIGGAAEERFD